MGYDYDRTKEAGRRSVTREDVGEATKAKKTIHEWSSELSKFADAIEKHAGTVDGWREKLPEPVLQARYYERVDDDLAKASSALGTAVSKLRSISHDLGGG